MEPVCVVATFGTDTLTGTVLEESSKVLKEKFFLRTEYGGDFAPPLMGKRDGQFLADALLFHLVRIKPFSAVAILGITPYDVYSEGLNFVFGLASSLHRAAVVSYARLISSDFDLFRSRVRKEITHEMGHVFGLEHCTVPGCVMNFSNSLYEVDLKGEDFCPNCKRKLERKLRELGII